MMSLELIEHRSTPRYRRLLLVRVGSLELMTANVSLHGMQLVCPIMRFKAIKADVRRGQLSGQISLPGGEAFGAKLAVRYCSQCGDECLIGVNLTLTDPKAQAQWAAYIDELSVGYGSRRRELSGTAMVP